MLKYTFPEGKKLVDIVFIGLIIVLILMGFIEEIKELKGKYRTIPLGTIFIVFKVISNASYFTEFCNWHYRATCMIQFNQIAELPLIYTCIFHICFA